jgi:hypothetical protein
MIELETGRCHHAIDMMIIHAYLYEDSIIN